MFFNELTPIWKELTQQPITFTGGVLSGLLRLSPSEDPLKTWLNQQGGSASQTQSGQGNNAPQSIDIE